jgi:hypothetical protein
MNMRGRRSRAAPALFTLVALLALAAPSLAATSGTVVDFAGGAGHFQMQVRQSGSSVDLDSLVLACSNSSSISVTTKLKVTSSGSFVYSGPATMISGGKDQKSQALLKASGTITFTRPGLLSSAKSATVNVSTTTKGCKAFSGNLKGYVVPPSS